MKVAVPTNLMTPATVTDRRLDRLLAWEDRRIAVADAGRTSVAKPSLTELLPPPKRTRA